LGFKAAKTGGNPMVNYQKRMKKIWCKPEENNHQSGIQPKEMWDERGH